MYSEEYQVMQQIMSMITLFILAHVNSGRSLQCHLSWVWWITQDHLHWRDVVELCRLWDSSRSVVSRAFQPSLVCGAWLMVFVVRAVSDRADGNKKGVLTRERQPKMGAFVIRTRYHQLANEAATNGYDVIRDCPHYCYSQSNMCKRGRLSKFFFCWITNAGSF